MILAALMAAAISQPPRQYTEAEIDDLKRTESRALIFGTYRQECAVGYHYPLKPIVIELLMIKRVKTDMALGITADDLRAAEGKGACNPLGAPLPS